jgi:hypothetical protein
MELIQFKKAQSVIFKNFKTSQAKNIPAVKGK